MSILFGWIAIWVINAAVIAATAYLLPGVSVKNFWVAMITALVLGFVNIFIRPFLLIFTLPINVVTFGLFTFVIDAFVILLVSAIVRDFKVKGFGSALLFSLIISVIRLILLGLFGV